MFLYPWQSLFEFDRLVKDRNNILFRMYRIVLVSRPKLSYLWARPNCSLFWELSPLRSMD